MDARLAAPLIRHVEDWRALITLHVYRGLIGFGLVALLLFGAAQQLFEVAFPDMFRLTCLAYLAQCALAMAIALSGRPRLRIQVFVACAVDIAFFTCLTLASTGVAGGLGMLLIAPLAAAGMLLSARIATLLAACAAIGILGQESLRPLQLPEAHSEWLQAGILGVLFFIAVAVSHWLSRRARSSEALAAERASEVRDLAELNRRIIQQMDIGAIVVDAGRRIQLINDAAIRLMELPGQAPQGRLLRHIAPELHDALEHWIESPHIVGNAIHPGSQTLLPLFSRLGRDTEAPVLVFLEDALRQSEQAQQLKLVSIGRLTASIAHEIRNPLGAISHAGQLLAESDAIGANERHLLDIIHRHTRRIDAIITNVLGLSRRSQLTRQRLRLRVWLRETVDDYREYNEQAPRFTIDGIDDTLEIEFDPGHLRQILFNLWDNAQRYARRDNVELEVRLQGERNRADLFCLEIIDNGSGIDAVLANQIMEPFFTTARGGTGLGLHIAGELCEANGARLTPVARSGGACFRVVFANTRPGA